ncbi:ATP-binding protein [Candidatus Saccharibacteria bacterium]|nr:ATP-binding protein [Candidatus Saccharibacteria bacterium]
MKRLIWKKLKQIDKARYILRTSIIFLMALLVLYMLTLQSGLVGHHEVYRSEYAAPMIFVLMTLIIYGLFLRKRHSKPSPTYHIAQYVMLGIFTVAISGFTPSIYLFWVGWLMLTALFFGRTAFIAATLYMYLVTIMAFILDTNNGMQQLGSGLTAMIATTVVAITVALIAEYTDVYKRLFEHAKQENEFTQNRLVTTINTIKDAIIGVDSKGRIRVYNPAAMILFDTNAELDGKRLTRYLTVVDSKKRPFDLWKYIKKENRSFTREDLSLVFADGDKVNLSVSCAPIIEKYHGGEHDVGKNEGYVLTLNDITNSKSLDEERDEFISVVSHELRTPVAVAEGALSNIQYLLEREIDPKTLSAQLAVAHGQIFYLGQMINDISTLSRAQRGVGAELELIDVREFFGRVEAQFADQIKDKKLGLVIDVAEDAGEIYSSKLYVQEILQNLMANAIKYTNKGAVTISSSKTPQGVLIAISDTGMGISKSDQKHIFDKFFRSEDFRTRETGGTGLGLYVVDKLAGLLHFKVKVKSELDKGSTFSFVLPAKAPEESEVAEQSTTTAKEVKQ